MIQMIGTYYIIIAHPQNCKEGKQEDAEMSRI